MLRFVRDDDVIPCVDAIRVDDMIARTTFTLFIAASAAIAQRSDTAAVCWRARTLANCKTWIITEAGLETPMTSSSATRAIAGGGAYVSDDFSARLAFTIGAMKNLDSAKAIGLTASLLAGQPPGRIEVRYHRWLAPRHGIDLSGGFIGAEVRGTDDWRTSTARGVTGAIGISNTYVGVDARFDLLHAADGRTVHASYLGVRAGSRAGPIAAVTGFGLFLGLFYLATRGGDY